MTETQGIYLPGPQRTLVLGNLTLGDARSAVFLSPPEFPRELPGKTPWTDTLFWDEEWKSIPVTALGQDNPIPSPLFIEISPESEAEVASRTHPLSLHPGFQAAFLTTCSDLTFLSHLLSRYRVPVVLDLRSKPQPQIQTLGALAAGVHGVILPWIGTEEWEALHPQIRSLVFSMERELVRKPQVKYPPASQKSSEGEGSKQLVVAFQGERGAYSELAVFSLFDAASAQARPLKAFREVYEAVLQREVDYGLLPLENALAGSIHDNFDLLLQYPDLHIIAETQIRIEHNLIVVPGSKMEDIRKVLSHPQGLAQSAAFLDQHPQWERVPFYDTAGSVAHIAQTGDRSLAAIASSVAAGVYGMEILKAGVETNPRNFTRFALIAPLDAPALGKANKASLVFSTAHSPGALSDCLSVLSAHGLNMRKIESRPIHGKPWAYMFYVDVEVPSGTEAFEEAMAELTEKASEFRLLGAYPSR